MSWEQDVWHACAVKCALAYLLVWCGHQLATQEACIYCQSSNFVSFIVRLSFRPQGSLDQWSMWNDDDIAVRHRVRAAGIKHLSPGNSAAYECDLL